MSKLTPGMKVADALTLLLDGPKTGAQIAEAIDEITPYVARMMARQRHLGRVTNLRVGTNKALYEITPSGRAALNQAGEG